MDVEDRRFPIGVVMSTYIIILVMYLWTYKYHSSLLWAFFVIERCMSFLYEEQIETYLDLEGGGEVKKSEIWIVFVFTLLGIGMFLYTPFKYPGLFLILIVGELIDWLVRGLRRARIKR